MNAAAHRQRIEHAIRFRAELRDDDTADTAALIFEAVNQPDHALPDLAEHFESEARIWMQATGTNPETVSSTAGTYGIS